MNSGDLKAFAALRLELIEERARLAARIKEIDDALGGPAPAPKEEQPTRGISPLEQKALDFVRANSGMPRGWYAERLVGPDLYQNERSASNALWRLVDKGLVRGEGSKTQRRIHAVI